MSRFQLVIIGTLITCCSALFAAKDQTLVVDGEMAPTADGVYYLWQRVPAKDTDMVIPPYPRGLTLESYVYTVRDRKARDVMRYVTAQVSTLEPVAEVDTFYRRVLGNDVQREEDGETGVVTLCAGTRDDVRLVTITPYEGYRRIRLAHVRRFAMPPRVYTAEERRVIGVIEKVARTYQSARRVSYTMTQQMLPEHDAPETPMPSLTWRVEYTRPSTLRVTAHVGDVLGLRIATEGDALVFTRPEREDQRISLTQALSTTQLPQLHGDFAARMMFAEEILPAVDYLALVAVKDIPQHQQGELVLTVPDRFETMRILLDLQRNVILRVETTTSDADGHTARMLRTYTDVQLEPEIAEPLHHEPPPHP